MILPGHLPLSAIDPLLVETGPWIVFALLAVFVFWMGRVLVRPPAPVPQRSLAERTLEHRPVFGPLTPALAQMFPIWFSHRLERDLRRAGFYWPEAKDELLAVRNVLLAGCVVATLVWVEALADVPGVRIWHVAVVAVPVTILLFSLPRLYVSTRAERRVARIMQGFPDALDALVMSISGGLPLQLALDRVAPEMETVHPDLALELEILRRQAFAGSLDEALKRLAQRIDEEPITALAESVSHAEQLGVDVAAAMIQYADQLRDQRLQQADEQGNKVSVKLLFPVVLCLAPAAAILLAMPPLLDLKAFRDRETQGSGLLVRPKLADLNNGSKQAGSTKRRRSAATTQPRRAVIPQP